MIFIKREPDRKLSGLVLIVLFFMAGGCSFTPTGAPLFEETTSIDPAGQEDQAGDNRNASSVNPYLSDRSSIPRQAESLFKGAVDALNQQQCSIAEEKLTVLTKEYPEYSGPWLNLAYLYRETDRINLAENTYKKAIEINPRNIGAYNELAILFREQGRFIESETTYKKALSIWNAHPDTHLNLAILYDLYMGRMDDALHHYRQYQLVQSEEDHKVKTWIADLQRRINRLVAENGHDS